MKTVGKLLVGAAAAAMMTVSAAPAQAQWGGGRYDHRYYERDRGVDAGDIITGVAIIGGIAAILGAINNDGSRYGYANRYQYRDNYRNAVNACGHEAQRFARGGRVQVSDVARADRNRFVVRGVVEQNRGGYGYDRYNRYDRYDRYGGGYYGRTSFSCYAHANGRVLDFDVNRY